MVKKVKIQHILMVAFFTSFCSLSYELTLAKTLIQFTDRVILWESLSIGFFLISTGIGLLIFPKIDVCKDLKFFIKIEVYLALIGLFSVPTLHLMHSFYRIYLADYGYFPDALDSLTFILVAMQAPNMMIGILSGCELALLFSLVTNRKETALLLAVNHLGALGSVSAWWIVAIFGVAPYRSAVFVSSLNLILALLICKYYLQKISLKYKTLSFVFVFLVCCIASGYYDSFYLKNLYYNTLSLVSTDEGVERNDTISLKMINRIIYDYPTVSRSYSSFQTIDLVPSKNFKSHFHFFLDGHFQFSSLNEKNYHEALANQPIKITGIKPRSMLILGGGDGLLLRDVLRNKTLISVVLCELDPLVLSFGKKEFSTLNENSLFNERVTIKTLDAFQWLRENKEKYDAILVDFPYPFSFDSLRLYSLEFFRLLRSHIFLHGYLAMDVPLNILGEDYRHMSEKDSRIVKDSLIEAGFNNIVDFYADGETFLVARPAKNYLSFKNKTHLINSVFKPKRISFRDPWK